MGEEQVGGLLVRSDAEKLVFKAPAPRTSLLGELRLLCDLCFLQGCPGLMKSTSS